MSQSDFTPAAGHLTSVTIDLSRESDEPRYWPVCVVCDLLSQAGMYLPEARRECASHTAATSVLN